MSKLEVLVMLLCLVVLVGVAVGLESLECSNYQGVTGKETQFKVVGGCYVNTGTDWVTLKQYGSVLVAREGLSHD